MSHERESERERSNCCENQMKLTKNIMMRMAGSLTQIIESRRARDCWFGDSICLASTYSEAEEQEASFGMSFGT